MSSEFDYEEEILEEEENTDEGKNEVEEIITKKGMSFITTPLYDLGDYLKNYKPEPSPYEGKYVFIR